jgi:hypothetical protein
LIGCDREDDEDWERNRKEIKKGNKKKKEIRMKRKGKVLDYRFIIFISKA